MTELVGRSGIAGIVVGTLVASGATFIAVPVAPSTDFDASDEEKQARLLRAYRRDERLDKFKLALRLDEYDEANKAPVGRPQWVVGPTVVKWVRYPSDGTGLSDITFDFGGIAFDRSFDVRGLAILDDEGHVAGKSDDRLGVVRRKATWHMTFRVYVKR